MSPFNVAGAGMSPFNVGPQNSGVGMLVTMFISNRAFWTVNFSFLLPFSRRRCL